MEKTTNFEEENAADILKHPATTKPKKTLDNKLSCPNTKSEDIRKRKKFHKSAKNEEPATKIPNTRTNFNFTASDETSDNECFISRLPTDLLSRIIELLPIKLWPKLESISRQFQIATFCAWRNLRDIDFMLIDDKFSLAKGKMVEGKTKLKLCLQKLNVRSPLITSISGFDKYVRCFNKSIIISAADFSHLRSVEFANLNFSPELFKLFFASLKNPNLLTELHFIDAIDYTDRQRLGAHIIDKCMMEIFRDTPFKLEVFSYINNNGCGGEFLEFIDATNLKKLYLNGSELLNSSLTCITEFFSECTELRYLNISDLRQFNEYSDCLHDDWELLLQAIASNCSKLETLEMGKNWFGDDENDPRDLFEGFSRLANLRRLDLTPHAVKSEFLYFPSEMFTAVTRNFPYLTELCISTLLDDEAPEFYSPLSRLENLESLELSTPNSEESTVLALVRTLSDLQNLHTLCLNMIMADGDNKLDSLCTLEKLQKLTVFYKGIKDKTLRSWARGGLMSRLKVLRLLYCKKVSDAGARYVAKYGSENLEELALTESAITVNGVRAILTACKRLRELHVRRCPQIDQRELENIEKLFGMVKIDKSWEYDEYAVYCQQAFAFSGESWEEEDDVVQ